MEYSGATITERAVRRRVERFFKRQDFENGVGALNSVLQPAEAFDIPDPSSSANRIILRSSRLESSLMQLTNSAWLFFLSPKYLNKYLLPQMRE